MESQQSYGLLLIEWCLLVGVSIGQVRLGLGSILTQLNLIEWIKSNPLPTKEDDWIR